MIKGIKHESFTTIVSTEEEQLVIQASPGQGGSWTIQAIATGVDGGRVGPLFYKHHDHGHLDNGTVLGAVRNICFEWGLNSIDILLVVAEFKKHWKIGEPI